MTMWIKQVGSGISPSSLLETPCTSTLPTISTVDKSQLPKCTQDFFLSPQHKQLPETHRDFNSKAHPEYWNVLWLYRMLFRMAETWRLKVKSTNLESNFFTLVWQACTVFAPWFKKKSIGPPTPNHLYPLNRSNSEADLCSNKLVCHRITWENSS